MRARPIEVVVLLLGTWGCGGAGGSGGPATTSQPANIPEMPPGPTKPAGTAAERVAKAKELAVAGDLPKAIATLEEALAIDHKDRDSLRLLARYFRDRGMAVESAGTTEYYKSLVSAAEYVRRLRDTYPDATDEEKRLALEVFYDETTAHAKSLRVEETTGSLRDLVGAGFTDFDRIRKDQGWRKILALPNFQKEFSAISAPGSPKAKTP